MHGPTITEITPEMYNQIVRTVYRVWQQVGFDCHDEKGKQFPNSHCIEICLDADRMLTDGNDKQANDWLRTMSSECYQKLYRKLCREVKL